MPDPNTLSRHATLVDHMASALGVDIEEMMLRGHLTFSQLDDVVLSCTNCTQPCACESWLSEQTEVVSEPPAYCRNAELFDTLRKA